MRAHAYRRDVEKRIPEKEERNTKQIKGGRKEARKKQKERKNERKNEEKENKTKTNRRESVE